ncbi:hypothetical protein CWS02_00485 [Enterobacter sp. EA-1]|nr:hypothetical protein CWS02_00485 [Enterobacter sp. EA-1]
MSELNDQTTDTLDLWYQGWQALLELAQYERRFALLELPGSTGKRRILWCLIPFPRITAATPPVAPS